MGLFGDDEEAQFEGDYKRAIRKRLLDEARATRGGRGHKGGGDEEAMARIVNNVYGGSGGAGFGGHSGGGVMDRLGGGNGGGDAPDGEDPFDYLVNITRKDLPDINPATGKPEGWSKTVHRYREPKGDGEPHKKKKR